MSFKLLEIGRDALRRVRIGRAALVAAAICAALAPTPSFAQTIDGDHTISADTKLTEDVTVNGQLILDGAAIDLNGHKLTVKGVTGQGVITDTLNDQYALYQELTYLESTTAGKQFIDTGYIHSTRSNVHIKFRHPSYSTAYTWFSYFGGGGRDKAYSFGGWIVYTGGKYYHWKSLGTPTPGEGSWAGSSANTDYHLFIRKSSAAGDSGNCYVANANNSGVVAGVIKASATEWPTDVTPVTAYLFGHHNLNGTLNSSYVGSRIYLCEIKDGGIAAANLVRNFIPMKRRADDKPGMMDKVNNKFYTNANPDSTADFTPGPATATTLTATAAEIAAAGTLVLDIDEGDSVNLSSLKLYGKVKLVKTGKGTLVQDVSADWVCGIEVQDGRLQTTDALAASIKTDLSIKAGATVSIACTGAASSTMPAAVSLEAGAKLLFDTTAFSGAGLEFTVGGITFGEGATASECIATANPLYGVTLESSTLIRLDRLAAPITAVWTGNGTAGDYDDSANWNCYNKLGGLLDNTTLPSSDTVLFRLDADADWTAKGAIALGAGVTLDLNGNSLTATSITGAGIVTDTVNLGDSTFKDADGNLYVQLEYIASSGSQYIDTGYRHNANSVADMKVAITVAPGNTWYCYYGSRTSEGNQNEFAGWVYKTHHWTGVAGAKGEQTSWSFTVNEPFLVHLDGAANATCNVDGHTFTHSKALTDSGYNDVLFAGRQGGTIPFFAAKARIYYCTIKEGNTVKRDFVAAMRASDRVLGMFDKENGVFYENKGSGTFVAGPVKASGVDAAASLHVTVAENATLSLGGLATICGNVKVVKEGAGVLTLPVDGQYFVGGLEVAAGTLSMTQTAAFFVGMPITATAGGTIEIAAGDGASYANDFTLAGGTLKVLASGTGNTTTAAIAGTLALETGAADAQPVVSIDMTDCTSATFQLNTTALNVGSGVTAAPGFVSLADTTAYEASIVDGTAIKVEHLTSPATAVWTGLGEAGNFDDPGNWSCSNKYGVALANTLPDNTTLTFRLGADADWTAKGAIALGTGVTLDLNGRTLTATSITGDGVVTDTTAADIIVADDGSMYQKIQYVQATQEGANNTSGQSKIQYVDTEYYHVGTTKVDIRVEFQDVSYSGNYGYAVYYGCRDQNNYKTAQLGGWLHNSKFYYYDTSEHDGSTAYTGRIYDIRLDKGGSSYANYEDGTLASTLGTGNGVGSSNTYGTDYIFANNQVPNGGKYWPCKCRVYSCKVYTGNTLERDFVPVRCISGANAGKAGFWCNVTKKFYGNSGYGDLTAGPLAQGETSGGELHLTVAENATLSLANTAKIAGNVKIVKDGLGTFVAPTTGHYFVGGIDVTAGTLSMGGALAYGGTINAASGTTVSVPASVGSAGTSVVNSAGGTLAVANCGTSVVTGTVTLGGGVIEVAGSFAPVSGTAAHTITLADGATLDFTQWTGEFPVASPTIAYASGANITLKLEPATTALTALARSKDAETGKRNGYLFSWDAIPTGVTFRPDAATDARFRVVPDENGLRMSFKAGLSIIIM